MRDIKVPRVELTDEARLLLDAEVLLSGRDMKSIVSDLIVQNASQRARDIAFLVAAGEPQTSSSRTATPPTPDPPRTDSSGSPARGRTQKIAIRHDPEAQILIRRRWAENPRPTYKSIADELGRAESAVYNWIHRYLLDEEDAVEEGGE